MKLNIHIPKAADTITCDSDELPESAFAAVFHLGLSVALNSRMGKVGSLRNLSGAELTAARTAARSIAERNWSQLVAGTRIPAQAKPANAIRREVRIEAIRIAWDVIRGGIEASGHKVSHVPVREIAKAAVKLIESNPDILNQAKANLECKAAFVEPLNLSALGITL